MLIFITLNTTIRTDMYNIVHIFTTLYKSFQHCTHIKNSIAQLFITLNTTF
jgi:hypothetical protein